MDGRIPLSWQKYGNSEKLGKTLNLANILVIAAAPQVFRFWWEHFKGRLRKGNSQKFAKFHYFRVFSNKFKNLH